MKLFPASEIRPDGTVICPTCKTPHALFYKRFSDTERKLFFLCRKHRRRVWDQFGYLVTRSGASNRPVEFVDGLNIEECWTKKYAKEVQNRQQLTTA